MRSAWLMFVILGGMACTAVFGAEGEGVFRHVVLFKFKETATEEKIREIEEAFRALPEKIDTIIDFEWGRSDTVEEALTQGYTHCFLVTFKDKAGLEVYLPHPAHKEFVALLRPHLEEAHVLDYVVRD